MKVAEEDYSYLADMLGVGRTIGTDLARQVASPGVTFTR